MITYYKIKENVYTISDNHRKLKIYLNCTKSAIEVFGFDYLYVNSYNYKLVDWKTFFKNFNLDIKS